MRRGQLPRAAEDAGAEDRAAGRGRFIGTSFQTCREGTLRGKGYLRERPPLLVAHGIGVNAVLERFQLLAACVAAVAARPGATAGRLPVSFTAAPDDDLGHAPAPAVVHATVRDGNYPLSTGTPRARETAWPSSGSCAGSRPRPLAPAERTSGSGSRLHSEAGALVALALRERETARARGDYASADSIRAPEGRRGGRRGHTGGPAMGTQETNWRNRR